MVIPLAEIASPLENAICEVANVSSSELWLAELRSVAGGLHSSRDFPISTVRKCAAVETAISDTPGELLKYYVWLASGCLTTAFIMTQRNSALRRIENSQSASILGPLLAAIRSGESFATVGFSHLTTSRRHLSQPPLVAQRATNSWVLDGFSPWVTGGSFADWLVVGAVEVDSHGRPIGVERPKELLFCIAKNTDGIAVEECNELIALNGSSTGQVRFEGVPAQDADVLHGPIENVMESSSRVVHSDGVQAGAGGLQTSALAIGHAAQAIEYLLTQSESRKDLTSIADGLQKQWQSAYADLLGMDEGETPQDSAGLRKRANDLALNSAQAALVAAKGLGFTSSHPVGRWCKEAMFFLVWSCPQSVAQAHLCSFLT